MSALNAAELLARVRKRKQELREDVSAEAAHPVSKVPKTNPYLTSAEDAKLAAAKPRLAKDGSAKSVHFVDETEVSYLPTSAPPPSKEWWDELAGEITTKVFRPGRARTPHNAVEGVAVQLTADELRRKRKHERYLKRHDAQERVRLGIDAPQQPKLKLSNVAAVVGPAFVQDPTRYEELARQSEAERRAAHEQANKDRELTPEQRWLKQAAKVESHRAEGLHSAVFRFESLGEETGKLRFLVDYTAKKFLFSGAVLMGAPALVVVEGGEPEIAKFTKLLVRKTEGCTLLWEGILSRPLFKKWSLHKLQSEALKRQFLQNHHALPYYLLMHDVPRSY